MYRTTCLKIETCVTGRLEFLKRLGRMVSETYLQSTNFIVDRHSVHPHTTGFGIQLIKIVIG